MPPSGDTASRPSDLPTGSLRFNTDSANLEYYRGEHNWLDRNRSKNLHEVGGGTGSNKGLGTRGLICGGYDAGHHVYGTTNIIDHHIYFR